MNNLSVATRKQLAYAAGYLELGLVEEAREELASIVPAEQGSPVVVAIHLEAAMAAQSWDEAMRLAEKLRREAPGLDGGWLHGAFAARRSRSGGLAMAREILEAAEPHMGDRCALLHYNLACYLAQQGDLDAARDRLVRAVFMQPSYAELARTDPDLTPLALA